MPKRRPSAARHMAGDHDDRSRRTIPRRTSSGIRPAPGRRQQRRPRSVVHDGRTGIAGGTRVPPGHRRPPGRRGAPGRPLPRQPRGRAGRLRRRRRLLRHLGLPDHGTAAPGAASAPAGSRSARSTPGASGDCCRRAWWPWRRRWPPRRSRCRPLTARRRWLTAPRPRCPSATSASRWRRATTSPRWHRPRHSCTSGRSRSRSSSTSSGRRSCSWRHGAAGQGSGRRSSSRWSRSDRSSSTCG